MDLNTFKTDADLEAEGAWIDIGEGASVKIARYQNPKHKRVLDRLNRPHRATLNAGRRLPDDVAEKILIDSFVEAVLLDWRGLTIDGQPFHYSKENALKVLTDMRDFRDLVANHALQAENFRRESTETAAGNSVAS